MSIDESEGGIDNFLTIYYYFKKGKKRAKLKILN